MSKTVIRPEAFPEVEKAVNLYQRGLLSVSEALRIIANHEPLPDPETGGTEKQLAYYVHYLYRLLTAIRTVRRLK